MAQVIIDDDEPIGVFLRYPECDYYCALTIGCTHTKRKYAHCSPHHMVGTPSDCPLDVN